MEKKSYSWYLLSIEIERQRIKLETDTVTLGIYVKLKHLQK